MSEPVRPSREELLAYAVGKLSDADSQRVAAFVESDPECQAVLATLDGTEDTLVGRLRLPPVDDPYEAESQCDAALARARDAAALEARSAESLELGTLGEYELLERLGQGGMGTVYKALHTKLDRVVALKVIASHRMHERQAVARFEREMKAIGRLDHPAIVHAMDAREIDGVPVLVMEYVDGMDLGRLVRRHGPIAMADACELIRRAALALEAAHQHGLVHRDVKPSNLMLSRSGQVKLLDLGLARLGAEPPIESDSSTSSANPSTPMRPVDDQTGLTATGQAMGTADYMAPEQVSDPQSVDIRADIYSLGCTLYKLLTGRAPFDGTDCGGTLDKLEAHTDRPAPPIAERVADLPPGLADTIDRMLSKSPDDRPPTPSAVAELLAPHCEGHDLPALLHRAETSPTPRRAPLPCPTPRPAASGRRWKPITAMIGLMLLSGGLGMALGVLVIIKYRDTEMAVNVPDGAKVDIGKDGQVKVDVQPSAPKTFASAPKTYEKKESDSETALSESDPFGPVPKLNEEALQGTWVVERYLNASGRTWLIEPIQPPATNEIRQQAAKTARITITGNTFDVRGKDVWRLSGRLQINPEESPALINIEQASGGLLTGICKLEGDRLTLCVVEDGPGYSTRPKDFWAPFGSTKELLVLKRINKAEIHPDEEALQGTWHVARVSVSGRKKQGMYHVAKTGEKVTGGLELFRPLAISLSETPTVDFGKSTVSFFDRERRGHLLRRYAIDPTADPATIDIDASLYVVGGPGDIVVGVRAVPGSFRGIYCMDGEKLIARFSVSPRDGGPPKPRPSGFDTKLTGDQFEWVLSRKKPAGKPEVVLRRETTRAQPPAPMPSVPQKQNSRVAATPPRTTLAPKPLKRTTPLLEPPSREAIQGTWAVESYSNASSGTWLIHPSGPWLGGSPVTDEGWRKIIQDAAKTAKIVITGDTFKVRGKDVAGLSGRYQANPKSNPAWIDIERRPGQSLLGIYELANDRLTLCVAEENAKRPTAFWPEFGTSRELLVLKRVGKAEIHPDEETLRGKWYVAKISAGKLGGDCLADIQTSVFRGHVSSDQPFSEWLSKAASVSFGKYTACFSDDSESLHAGVVAPTYVVDPTVKPPTIDVDTSGFLSRKSKPNRFPGHHCSLRGIYQLDAEGLKIRFAVSPGEDGSPRPRPSGFDAPLTEDQFELVLERKKPGREDAKDAKDGGKKGASARPTPVPKDAPAPKDAG